MEKTAQELLQYGEKLAADMADQNDAFADGVIRGLMKLGMERHGDQNFYLNRLDKVAAPSLGKALSSGVSGLGKNIQHYGVQTARMAGKQNTLQRGFGRTVGRVGGFIKKNPGMATGIAAGGTAAAGFAAGRMSKGDQQ